MIDRRIRHRTVKAGRIFLHCAELGDPSRPLVLLLHGFPECWVTWRLQLPALAEAGFFAVAPDLRGYGDSSKPPGVRSYRVEELASDVASLIEAYGRSRAVVVGHDWGAWVGWHLAMWHPTHVERLAVLNVAHPERMRRALRTVRQLRKSWYAFFFQLPWLPEWRISRNGFASVKKLLRFTPARRGAYDEGDVAAIVAALSKPGALTAALNYYRAAKVLKRRWEVIRAPVLVIWGEQDRWLGSELAEPDPRWVPDCRVERLPAATHWVQADEPARVNDLLLRFLR